MHCYFGGFGNDNQAGLNSHTRGRYGLCPANFSIFLKTVGFEDFKCTVTEQQLHHMAVYCGSVEDKNIFLE